MNENTIFQGGNQSSVPQSIPKPSPTAPLPQVPQQPAQPLIPPVDDEGSFFSSFHSTTILKIGLALVILIVIVVGISAVLLPMFSRTSNEKVTLTYWGLWEDSNVMQSILSDFHKEHPNITIEYVKQDHKQYLDRLVTRIKNNTGPDIYRFHSSWLPQVSNYLLPLSTEVISNDQLEKGFYPVVQKDVTKDGAIYGIPYGIDTLALFVNPEIFQAAGVQVPQNWNDFIKAARDLTVKDENGVIKTSGASLGSFDNVSHAPDIIAMFFAQNGANIKDLGGTAANATDALEFYTSFARGEGNVWDSTLESSIIAFAKGNVAMYFGYSWDIFTIKAINPNAAITVHPVPHLPGREMTVASYWVEGVSSQTKHPKEALLFMNYITKPETEQKLYAEQAKTRLFGTPYARVDLAPSLKDNALIYPFVQQAPTATSSYFAGDTYDNGLNSQLNGYLGNAVRSVLNGSSAQSAVETLAQGVTAVLNQYGVK